MKYINRAIEPQIIQAAKQFPVIALTGPRQTGKSTLLQKLFSSYTYITLDDPSLRRAAITDPGLFIENLQLPVIIDEIQYAPQLLPFIKITVDRARDKNGLFILTGSQMFPLMAGISESLAGRIALFELLGFSWEELSPLPKTSLACYGQLLKGFYPVPSSQKIDVSRYYASYISTYLERDIRQIQNVQDISVFQLFLQLVAARAGQLLNIAEISKECGVSTVTVKRWVSLLESTRIIYLLRPYFKNITKRVVKSPKLYFTDTGLLAYLLKYPTPETLMAGPQSGAFFENMIIMEALKHKFNHGAQYEMYFYQDSHHNETDLILDYGLKVVLAEMKATKNITPKLAAFSKNTPFQDAVAYVVSFADNEIALTKQVKAIPWQNFNPSRLAGGK